LPFNPQAAKTKFFRESFFINILEQPGTSEFAVNLDGGIDDNPGDFVLDPRNST
jgi:hypothetical protein